MKEQYSKHVTKKKSYSLTTEPHSLISTEVWSGVQFVCMTLNKVLTQGSDLGRVYYKGGKTAGSL